MPVASWARWLGAGWATAGFLAGIFSLITLFVFPQDYTSTIPRVVFGYAAPVTFAIIWGSFGALGGAILASTYNHIASVFGGIKIKCSVMQETEPYAQRTRIDCVSHRTTILSSGWTSPALAD
jgi:hypothetical protein